MYIIYKMLYNRHQCYSKFFHFKCIELFINLTHIFKISKTVTCPNTLFHRSLNRLKTDVSVHIFFKQLHCIFNYYTVLYFKKYIIFLQTNDPSLDKQKQCIYNSLLIPPSNVNCMYSLKRPHGPMHELFHLLSENPFV